MINCENWFSFSFALTGEAVRDIANLLNYPPLCKAHIMKTPDVERNAQGLTQRDKKVINIFTYLTETFDDLMLEVTKSCHFSASPGWETYLKFSK